MHFGTGSEDVGKNMLKLQRNHHQTKSKGSGPKVNIYGPYVVGGNAMGCGMVW